MKRFALLAVLAAAFGVAPAADAETYRNGSVRADVGLTSIELSNSEVVRRWSRAPFRTVAMVDRRGADRQWSTGSRDFSLSVGGLDVGSERFTVQSVDVTKPARGGLRVSMELAGPLPGLKVTRVAEAYPGVAGFRMQTVLESVVPLVLS